MTPEYEIKLASLADIPTMIAVERRAVQVFRGIGYDFCADGPLRDPDEHERVIRTGRTFVAARELAVIGFAMFEPIDGDIHLVEIDVDTGHQRQGLAQRLIAVGAEWALAKGFDAMTLTTYRDVSWNAPFYRRLGFIEFEPGPERKGLLETIAKEAAWGFAFRPRIAMRKRLV